MMTTHARFLIPVVLIVAGSVSIPAQELRHDIDRHIKAGWQREQIKPAPLANDGAFLRRVYLDLAGIIPSYEQTKQFLADKNPDKRTQLIDKLLDDPRFAIHQADVWDMILFGRSPASNEARTRPGFQKWLQEQFANNVAYDQWVRALLKADGNTVDNGAPMFLAQYGRKPEDAAEAITQKFLGVQLQCARCHDHPFEAWKQKDFFGMAAFLARLENVSLGKKNNESKIAIGEKNKGDIMFTGPAADATPGKKGEPIKPKFLLGSVLEEPTLPAKFTEPRRFASNKMPPKPKFSRKDKLAEWITSAGNPYFAKAIANRIWGQFMGRGIINPVDNLSQSQRATHPELLDLLAKEMVKHKFDLKWYIRELCNSKSYQLSSIGEVADAKPRWFEQARVRPLSAEELLESWRVATDYDAVAKATGKAKGRFYGVTWGYMVSFFGRPSNGVGDFQGGLHEHLFLNNGQVFQLITSQKGGLLDTLLKSKEPVEKRVQRLYLSVLNRMPRPAEQEKFVAYLSEKDNQADRFKEAIWVLMTCSEFRFNH